MHMPTQAGAHACAHAHMRAVKSSRMLHCVHWYVVTNVSKKHTASEISVTTYQLTWHNIPQELSLQQQHCKHLKSQNIHSILSTKHTFSFQFKSMNNPL